jgi:hypothetical protein
VERMKKRKFGKSVRRVGWLILAAAPFAALFAQQQPPPPSPAQRDSQNDQSEKDKKGLPAEKFLPRGKKLCMTNGDFQIVRSYERNGETVRYYSVERSSWEEIPASMVDWDATAKAETEQAKKEKDFKESVGTREKNQGATQTLDVDASLEIAPGVILPQDDGMFAIVGTKIVPLQQSMTEIKLDKGHEVGRVLLPIPIIPQRHHLELKGKHAALRLPNMELQFYYRTAEDAEPEIELIHVTEKGSARLVEWINTDIVGDVDTKRNTISILKWVVAPGVYRFTMGQALEPGEYALAVVEPEGINYVIWDFGVDAATPPVVPPKKK